MDKLSANGRWAPPPIIRVAHWSEGAGASAVLPNRISGYFNNEHLFGRKD
jgi:hypothetical protein